MNKFEKKVEMLCNSLLRSNVMPQGWSVDTIAQDLMQEARKQIASEIDVKKMVDYITKDEPDSAFLFSTRFLIKSVIEDTIKMIKNNTLQIIS